MVSGCLIDVVTLFGVRTLSWVDHGSLLNVMEFDVGYQHGAREGEYRPRSH